MDTVGAAANPKSLPHGDPRRWPARHGCPVGRLRHLEIVYTSDVFDDAVSDVVPDVYAEGEVGLGFHGQRRQERNLAPSARRGLCFGPLRIALLPNPVAKKAQSKSLDGSQGTLPLCCRLASCGGARPSATNKCLAKRNKSRTGAKATKIRSRSGEELLQ